MFTFVLPVPCPIVDRVAVTVSVINQSQSCKTKKKKDGLVSLKSVRLRDRSTHELSCEYGIARNCGHDSLIAVLAGGVAIRRAL
jgi:hypothetical protein